MKRFLIHYLLIVHSIILYWFVNDKSQYIPMLAVMYISPILLIINIPKKGISSTDLILFSIGLLIFSTAYTHPERFRISTVLYSLMFITTYSAFCKLLDYRNFNIKDALRLFRFIIKSYAIVIIIQQFSVILHIPIFNLCWEMENNIFKLNSLSMEPSNTGPILTIIMYSYVKLNEFIYDKKLTANDIFLQDKWLCFSYVYTLITCISVTCIISLIILALYFIPKKQKIKGIGIVVLLSTFFFFLGTEVGDRILKLIPAILSLDARTIYHIDSSSSARIVPFLIYISDFEIFNINTWLGYGCDYGGIHMASYLFERETENNEGIGGIIGLMYNYGLLASLLFFYLIFKICKKNSFELILYFALFFVIGFNHYMTWLYMMMIYLVNYYRNIPLANLVASYKVPKRKNNNHI